MKERNFDKENATFAYFCSQQKRRIKQRPALTLEYRRQLKTVDTGHVSGFSPDYDNLAFTHRKA